MAIELILTGPDECRPLREAVLRPGQPRSRSIYPGDDDERAVHFTMKQGKRVLGAVTLLHAPRAGIGSETWRIRGMAVLPEHQGEGLGTTLMRAVQAVAEKRGGGIWANVRMPAVGFYAAHGFQALGEEQDGHGKGGQPHQVMTWHPAP